MPIAESIIGEPLSATTVSCAVPGLKRRLSASLDGATFGDTENAEHKTLSESLAAAMDRGEIPEQYPPQMEQGMMVTGATRCLFIASKWDDNDQLIEEKHLWYESNPELRAKIIAAWKQVEADVDSYQHTEAAPVATAAPINELPALMVEITGSVTASNLADWKAIVTDRIAGINTNLQTDTDFANADAMVKFLDDGEKRIDLVKSQAQANAADIDRVFRALDEIKASMRAKRLELDKLVTKRKESIKIEIMQAGKDQLAAHIAMLDKRIGEGRILPPQADFATAIKGKRNLESMRGAVADLVAAKKIEANEIADKVQINLASLNGAKEYAFLFSDRSALAMKAPDDLALVIKSRIADHLAAEAKKLEAIKETARIEAEANAAAKVKADQEAEDALIAGFWANARRIEFDSVPYIQKAINTFECMAPDWENDPRPRVSAAVADARKEMQDKLAAAKARAEREEAERQRVASDQPATVAVQTRQDEPAAQNNQPQAGQTLGEAGRRDTPASGLAKPVITIDGPFTSDIQIQKPDNGRYIRRGEINA